MQPRGIGGILLIEKIYFIAYYFACKRTIGCLRDGLQLRIQSVRLTFKEIIYNVLNILI